MKSFSSGGKNEWEETVRDGEAIVDNNPVCKIRALTSGNAREKKSEWNLFLSS